MSKKNKPAPGQLLLLEYQLGSWMEAANPQSQPNQSQSKRMTDSVVSVYVGITFDPCQGIREAKDGCRKSLVPLEVVFDCRPLELAPDYASGSKVFFEPDEQYLIGRGGLLNIAVFVNLLRCYNTLREWSDERKETGIQPIRCFNFIPPDPKTSVGRLWEVLGMPNLTTNLLKNEPDSGVMEFQSRYVAPLLYVNSSNRNRVLPCYQNWLNEISDRLGEEMVDKLWPAVPEIVRNLVNYGHEGFFGMSVWPSGQVELNWSNPVGKVPDWPPDNTVEDLTAVDLANILLSRKGGGMAYIYDELLPPYKGVLIVNWQTHHLIFRSVRGDFSIMGLKPRSNAYVPKSILFTMHLFCSEIRDRSSKNARN